MKKVFANGKHLFFMSRDGRYPQNAGAIFEGYTTYLSYDHMEVKA